MVQSTFCHYLEYFKHSTNIIWLSAQLSAALFSPEYNVAATKISAVWSNYVPYGVLCSCEHPLITDVRRIFLCDYFCCSLVQYFAIKIGSAISSQLLLYIVTGSKVMYLLWIWGAISVSTIWLAFAYYTSDIHGMVSKFMCIAYSMDSIDVELKIIFDS